MFRRRDDEPRKIELTTIGVPRIFVRRGRAPEVQFIDHSRVSMTTYIHVDMPIEWCNYTQKTILKSFENIPEIFVSLTLPPLVTPLRSNDIGVWVTRVARIRPECKTSGGPFGHHSAPNLTLNPITLNPKPNRQTVYN